MHVGFAPEATSAPTPAPTRVPTTRSPTPSPTLSPTTLVEYLFYWPGDLSNLYGTWLIGPNYTSNSTAWVHSDGVEALCPELATGLEIRTGTAWSSTPAITVQGMLHAAKLAALSASNMCA